MKILRKDGPMSSLMSALLFIAGLLYGTGFLIATSFFGRLGIRETGADFLKAEYIQIGVLYWALPLVASSPLAALILRGQAISKQLVSESGTEVVDGQKLGEGPDRRFTIPVAIVLGLLVGTFYMLAIFAPPGLISDDSDARKAISWFLIAVIASMILIVLDTELHDYIFAMRDGGVILNGLFQVTGVKKTLLPITRIVRKSLLLLSALCYLGFAIYFGYILRDRLRELGLGQHCLHTLALVTIMLLLGVIVSTMFRRQKHYARNRGRLFAFWASGIPLIGLLWYLSLLAFSHSVCVYIPASRGGGDFTTMPTVVLHFKDSKSTAGVLALKDGISTSVVLIRENAITLYVAVPNKANGPEQWRRYESKPTIVAIPRELIEQVEYIHLEGASP